MSRLTFRRCDDLVPPGLVGVGVGGLWIKRRWWSTGIGRYARCWAAHGSYKRREAMLWQKISPTNDYATLVPLLTTDIPRENRGPGTYMFEALKHRDQWESRLLRTSAWSPLY
jgi:hypothetical protein